MTFLQFHYSASLMMDFKLSAASLALQFLAFSLLQAGSVRTTTPGCPDKCDLRDCPVVSAAECPGTIVKDECSCCPVCQPPPGPDSYDEFYGDVEDGMMTPNYVNASHKELCEQITCSRLQICTVNIQGIPICRCPSDIYCRQQRLRRRAPGMGGEVCGRDGQTYKSRCFLRSKECTENKRIKVKHDGRCFQGSGGAKKDGKKKKGNTFMEPPSFQQQQQRKDERREMRKQRRKEERQLNVEAKREQRREEKKALKKQERRDKKRADKKEEAARKSAKKQGKADKKDSNKMKKRQRRVRRRNANSRNKRGKKNNRGRRSCSDGELDVDAIVV